MQEVMRDPVLAVDGHTYEREAIESWLQKHGTSPMTNQVLDTKDLRQNLILKQMVQSALLWLLYDAIASLEYLNMQICSFKVLL